MTLHETVIDMAILHGRMQMLNELTEIDFPLTNTRLVNLLSKFKPRSWKSFSRVQKEICIRATEGRTDEASLTRAFKIARKV